VPRKRSAAQLAKRQRQFHEHLAQKNNPVRFVAALPPDVDLVDIDWNPDHLEQIADKLRLMKARWEREDDQRRRERCAEILAAVERDRARGEL
jgi:hypothetical protein